MGSPTAFEVSTEEEFALEEEAEAEVPALIFSISVSASSSDDAALSTSRSTSIDPKDVFSLEEEKSDNSSSVSSRSSALWASSPG